jgi:hypothetical protein
MSAISDAELADMQADAVDSLTESCTVSHTPLVSDGAGGQTNGTVVVYGPYACRIEQSGRNADNLPVVAGGQSPRRYVYIVLEPGALVSPQDTIIIGLKRYPVIAVPEHTLQILLRVQCWEPTA